MLLFVKVNPIVIIQFLHCWSLYTAGGKKGNKDTQVNKQIDIQVAGTALG